MIIRTILIVTAIVVALVAIVLWLWAAYNSISCIKVCRTDDDGVVARFRTAWEAECYLDDRPDEGLYIQY